MEAWVPNLKKKDADGNIVTPIGVFPSEDMSCPDHGGRKIVAEHKTKDKGSGEETVVYEFSDNIGPQADCPDCDMQQYLMLEHVNAVIMHDEMTKQLTKRQFGFPFAIRDGEGQAKLRAALEEAARAQGLI